ncbi:interleukin-6 receptor subunit beta [Rhinoraja longicauda]
MVFRPLQLRPVWEEQNESVARVPRVIEGTGCLLEAAPPPYPFSGGERGSELLRLVSRGVKEKLFLNWWAMVFRPLQLRPVWEEQNESVARVPRVIEGTGCLLEAAPPPYPFSGGEVITHVVLHQPQINDSRPSTKTVSVKGRKCGCWFIAKTTFYEDHQLSSCPNPWLSLQLSGGPHGLECYFTGDIKNGFNCSWTSGTYDTNKTRYVLKIHWRENSISSSKRNTTLPGIAGPFHTIPRSKLYISANASIWVETMDSCLKSKPITLVPLDSGRPEAPSSVKYSRTSGQLHLKWTASEKYLYQVAIRKPGTIEWQEFNFKQAGTIDALEQPAAYEFKARCKTTSATGLWSLWSNMHYVPPELTSKLQIHTPVTELLTDPGRRSVFIHWEAVNASGHDHTRYNITIERLPAGPRNMKSTLQLDKEEYRLQLSQAAFKVRIQAYNSVSYSPASEILISPYNPIELRNKIKATALGNDSLFVSWNPIKGKRAKYVIDWGPVTGNEMHIKHSKVIPKGLQNYTLKGQFHPKQRYRIMLHKRAKKRKELTLSEETIGTVDVYTVEGTPNVAPTNITVTDIQKSSATIRWDHIPEDECQGFLQGYKIFYYSRVSTDSNLTIVAAVTVNSSTTNYTLRGLLQKTFYALEISGFTKAGEGTKSRLVAFETKDFGELVAVAVGVCVAIIILVFLLTWTCSLLVHRIKKIFWPNIPNPGNSHAIQIIGRVSSMTAGSPHLNTSLLEMERQESLENLHTIEEVTSSLIDGGPPEYEPNHGLERKPQGHLTDRPTVVQVTDYTTMENFQQIMPTVGCNKMLVEPSGGEMEGNDPPQGSDTVIPSCAKQRVHHTSTDPAQQNPSIPLATECPESLNNFDNVKTTRTLHSQGLSRTNS